MGFLRMHALTRRDGAAFLRGSACLFAFVGCRSHAFDEVVAGVGIQGHAVGFAAESGKATVEGFEGGEVAQQRALGGPDALAGHEDGDAGRGDGDHGGGHLARRLGQPYAMGATADQALIAQLRWSDRFRQLLEGSVQQVDEAD